MGVLVKFNFNDLSDADVNLIGELLDDQPYKRVAGLAKRLQVQIDAQIAEAKAATETQQRTAFDRLVDNEITKRGFVKPTNRKQRKG